MKRALVYLVLISCFIGAVIFKIGIIVDKRNVPTISITNEKKQHGKPIEVYKIKNENMKIHERLTGQFYNGSLNLYVSKSQWRKLKQGMEVVTTSAASKGRIVSVANSVSSTTGLYQIKAKLFNTKNFSNGQTVIVDVNVMILQNVIKVPASAVKKDEEGAFLLVLADGKTVKRQVKEGRSSGNFIQILTGVSSGERVIIRGGSALHAGDKIRINEGGV